MTDVISSEVRKFAAKEYEYGFTTDLDTDVIPRGLSEDIVRMISAKKNEPDWMLGGRLKAYQGWLAMEEPKWQNVGYEPIDYQDINY